MRQIRRRTVIAIASVLVAVMALAPASGLMP
jgi:hypothetical protein